MQDLRSLEGVSYRLPPKPGYEALAQVFDEMLEQAQTGKGHVRHGDDGVPWTEQPIFEIPRALGPLGAGFIAGQIAKKLAEAWRLPPDRRHAELLGIGNYVAALVLLAGEEEAAG